MQHSIKYYLCTLMNVFDNTFICLFLPKLFAIYYFIFKEYILLAFKENYIDISLNEDFFSSLFQFKMSIFFSL